MWGRFANRFIWRPFPAQLMAAFPVSKRVNSPKSDDADLIASIAA